MGTGKTSVGKKLAQRLQRSFIEMDQEIEKRERMSIAQIFKEKGESYFRAREAALVKQLALQRGLVIATGGGVVLDPQNISLFAIQGIMICLDASVDVIYDRVKSYTHRPLLQVPDPRAAIEQLLLQRKDNYAQIPLHVTTNDKSVDQIVNEIIQIVQQHI